MGSSSRRNGEGSSRHGGSRHGSSRHDSRGHRDGSRRGSGGSSSHSSEGSDKSRDLKFNPTCEWCSGTGKHYRHDWVYSTGLCTTCRGTGLDHGAAPKYYCCVSQAGQRPNPRCNKCWGEKGWYKGSSPRCAHCQGQGTITVRTETRVEVDCPCGY